MRAEGQKRVLRQDAAQAGLALDERKVTKILAAGEHDVEDAIAKRRLCPQRILQQLEMRYAAGIEGNQLAIEHRIHFDLFQGLRHDAVAFADGLAVAGVEGDLSADYGG